MREDNEMRGTLTMRVTDGDGLVVYEAQHKNRIVTSGRNLVAQLFAGIAGGVPPGQVTHMAVGTDATPATDADNALRAERVPRRAISSVDYSEISEGSGASEVKRVRARLTAVFDFGDANGTEPLREAGSQRPHGGDDHVERREHDGRSPQAWWTAGGAGGERGEDRGGESGGEDGA